MNFHSTAAVLEAGYPEVEELCTSTAQFSFNLDTLADVQPITLQKGLLRVYVQTKSAEYMDIELSARIYNSKAASVVTQVTTTKGPSDWIEIAVTDALHAIFNSNSAHLDGSLDVLFQAKLDCKEQEAETAIHLATPLLVLFLDANETFPINKLRNFKRSTELDEEESGFGNMTSEPAICQRQPFLLDFASFFRNLPRDNVILLPREVDIGFCSGRCHSKSTIRATFFAILEAPIEPCCSPREFQHLDVLLQPSPGLLVIERLINVIATSCDCQV